MLKMCCKVTEYCGNLFGTPFIFCVFEDYMYFCGIKNLLLMKKYTLLFLFVFFLFACSDDKTDMPHLELYSVSLNGGDEDYSRDLKEILPLSPSDYIDVSFLLDGGGADLKTFVVKNENNNIKPVMFFYRDEVSDEFTELSEGIIGYKDGIRSTYITVKLKVMSAKNDEFRIGFYLNSKAPDCEGAVHYLDLETTTEPRVNEEEE